MPKVSILMVTYNQSKYIEESIKSALNQSFSDFELIVMDDASSDGTKEIVKVLANKDERIKYFKNDNNVQIVRNRNSGIEKATGEYLAILDSDDIWTNKDKLKNQVDFLDNNLDFVLAGTQTNTIDENGNEIGKLIYETEDSQIRNNILLRNQFVNSSVLMRLESVKKVDSYSSNLVIGEDYDLFLKLGLIGMMCNLPSAETAYRVHSNGITKQKKLIGAQNHLSIIRKYKDNYPNYIVALIKSYLRILISKL